MYNEAVSQNYHEMNKEERRKGFKIHSRVYLGVSILLTAINLILVPEFLWFVFPVIGMGLGLALHYYLAIVKGV